jgi:hypothetical protein
MDTQINKILFEGLKEYNSRHKKHGNEILEVSPKNKVYPFTVLSTVRDTDIKTVTSHYGKRSSKGYRLDIYAQNKGKILRKEIADDIAQQLDEFMSDIVNLERTSYNGFDLENDGTVFHLIVMYSSEYDEYRRKFT